MHTPSSRRRSKAASHQGRFILPGLPAHAHRPRYPRDHDGRAAHDAARRHLRMDRQHARLAA